MQLYPEHNPLQFSAILIFKYVIIPNRQAAHFWRAKDFFMVINCLDHSTQRRTKYMSGTYHFVFTQACRSVTFRSFIPLFIHWTFKNYTQHFYFFSNIPNILMPGISCWAIQHPLRKVKHISVWVLVQQSYGGGKVHHVLNVVWGEHYIAQDNARFLVLRVINTVQSLALHFYHRQLMCTWFP